MERARAVMGSVAIVRIEALGSEAAGRDAAAQSSVCDTAIRLAEGALDRIDEVDRSASLYKEDSDLVSINGAAFPGPVPTGALLGDLLARSLELARITEGAFDPTVKPLMDQLGFYREIGSRPDPLGMRAVLRRVGWRKVRLDRGSGTVRFTKPGMAIDLGGIGKGYALDLASRYLRDAGVQRAQIELSRSFAFIGRDPETPGGRFRLGVASPSEAGTETVRGTIDVPEGFVATSSPLSQQREADGKLVGHIVDPRRGALETDVLSVTIWAGEGATADAIAKAIIVSGPKAMRSLSRRIPFEALVFVREPHANGSQGNARVRSLRTNGLPFVAAPES